MKTCSILTFLIVAIGCNLNAQTESKAYKRFLKGIYHKKTPIISCDSLNEAFKNYTLIDTRSKEEYDVGHIQDANFIDFDDYQNTDLSQYDKDEPIIFYCSVGWRSQEVTEYFMEQGYNNVHNLYGGIFEWSNKDLPMYNPEKQDTDSVHVFSKKWGFWLKNGIKVY